MHIISRFCFLLIFIAILFNPISSSKKFPNLMYFEDKPTTDVQTEKYKLIDIINSENTRTYKLENIASETKGYKNAPKLLIKLTLIKKDILRIEIDSESSPKYRLPNAEPFPYHKDSDKTANFETCDFDITNETDIFSLTVRRRFTKDIIFTTANFNIIIGEDANYSEISTAISTKHLFGFGERTSTMRLTTGTYTIWNRDTPAHFDDKKQGGESKYGTHPMYLNREASIGNFHITYLRNPYPMDLVVDEEAKIVTWKVAGGVLDFTIFLGDFHPETVIKKYHTYLGGYITPPFWSMGFHQSRWGYTNTEDLMNVLKKYAENDIPFDTLWVDIDYMVDKQPITVDENRYDFQAIQQALTKQDKHFVMIAEPAVALKDPNAPFYKKGLDKDIFIKNNEGKNLINRVWPGKVHFIDYFHPSAGDYWNESLDYLYDKLRFSGVWLDMNEIASFVPGQVDENDKEIPCNDVEVYPYVPGKSRFDDKTICMNAVLHGGQRFINLHNYYPVQQGYLTYKYLESKEQFKDSLPFILTRGNAAGSGKYVFHWTGDNASNYNFLKYSIMEVANMNLFGTAMVGADICGFAEVNTDEYFCAQFYQLGSLYPFARSHFAIDSNSKEPYAMKDLLKSTARASIRFRYSVLKYYYSHFLANNGIGAIFRPLFYNFPDDENCYNDEVLDSQFMIGEDLLVAPNVSNIQQSTRHAYFPDAFWYNLREHKLVLKGDHEINVPLSDMPTVFLQGGKTIFRNIPDMVKSTKDLNDIFYLDIAFDSDGKSIGRIPALGNYHSKKSVQSCFASNCFIQVTSQYIEGKLTVEFTAADFYDEAYTYLSIAGFRLYNKYFGENYAITITNLNDIVQKDRKGPVCTYKFENEFSAFIDINGVINLKRDVSLKAEITFNIQ
jgi:alpha-glucosidase (family GH31 glycosyl hydrolase)